MRMQQSVKQQAKLKSKCKQYRQFMATSATKSIEKQATRQWCRTQKQQQRRADRPIASIGIHITSIRLASLYLNYFPLVTPSHTCLALVCPLSCAWNLFDLLARSCNQDFYRDIPQGKMGKLVWEMLSENTLENWDVVFFFHYIERKIV